MTDREKLIQAIIKNSNQSRPTITWNVDKIKHDCGLSDNSFAKVLGQLESEGLIKCRYGSNELAEIHILSSFPK